MRKLLLVFVLFVAVSAMGQGEGMQPVVAPDGTVLVVRPVASDFRMASELLAISPAGTILWKYEGSAMPHGLAVRDGRVFVTARNAEANDEVVALSLATGAVQWRREVTGAVAGLEATADRVYVVTRADARGMNRGMNGGDMNRGGMNRGGMHGGASTLSAIDAVTGATLWTVELK